MPRAEKPKRWSEQETIDVLKFINDNFDMWWDNRHAACAKAIEVTGVSENRDTKSTYNKVHTMLKTMENIDDRGKKRPNDPIWGNREILKWLRKICAKSKERKEEEETQDPAIQVERNTNTYEAVSFLAEMSSDTVDEEDDTSNELIVNEKFKIFDARYKEFQELPGRIKQIRSELGELEKNLHEKEERLKVLKLLFEE